MKKPLGIARTSCEFPRSAARPPVLKLNVADLNQNKLMKKVAFPHICKCDSTHDYQSTDHKPLRPCF